MKGYVLKPFGHTNREETRYESLKYCYCFFPENKYIEYNHQKENINCNRIDLYMHRNMDIIVYPLIGLIKFKRIHIYD